MNRIDPEDRRQMLWLLPTVFQVLDQIKQQVYRSVLPGWSVLIHDCKNSDGFFYAR